jgi:hypothetical protein
MMENAMKNAFLGLGLAALLCGSALAQVNPVPLVQSVGPQDLFRDVLNGQPGSDRWATGYQINGPVGYQKFYAPASGVAVAFTGPGQTYVLLYPTATIAAATVTLAATPGDGQRDCVRSTQVVTALTVQVASGSGQSINNGPTTLPANTVTCMLYSAFNATWDPA